MRLVWLWCALSVLAGAQTKDISGTWVAKVQTGMGEQEVAYRFKVENGKITGTQIMQFGESPIIDGKVNGDEFDFTVEMDRFGQKQQVKGTGKIVGDDLQIMPAMPGPPPQGAGGPGGPGGPGGQRPPGMAGGPGGPGGPGGGGMRRMFSGPVIAKRGTPTPSYRAPAVDYATLPKITLPAIQDVPHNGLALTPPMGWNSWNKFRTRFDDKTVREIADAMVASGMKAAGYQYINIDDGWQWKRDEKGELMPNPNFPNMKALADYVHSKGLKLGIYSSPGPRTCANYEGSYGHELQDAKTWAAWGIDYLKYDWCSAGRIWKDEEMRPLYQRMGEALRATGRPIVYSLCQYGRNHVEQWGPFVSGNLWRTTGDIRDAWQSMKQIGFSQSDLAGYAGPGHWNDPDMLEVGNGGMTPTEYKTHFSLWAILAAPLIAGNDIRNMTPEIKEILLNRDVIAVDQDKAGKGGFRVSKNGDAEIWMKPLDKGAVAVALFNVGETPVEIPVKWSDVKFEGTPKVRDLWKHEDLGKVGSGYTAKVDPHGVVMLRLGK